MKTERLIADQTNGLELTCALSFEAAEATGEKPALPRFRMVAYTGGAMRVGGWRYPVVVDLSGLNVPSQHRPIRLGHDESLGVGHTDEIKVQGHQLIATGVVSRDTHAAREVVVSSRNGFPWQASIGAAVEEAEFLKENQKAVVNGHEVIGPLNIVRKATLGEISFVDLGADGKTSASVAASQKESPDHMDPKNQSESNAQPTPAAPPTPTIAASAPQPATPPAAQVASAAEHSHCSIAAIRAEAAAEVERIAAIRKICDGKHAEIEAKSIREGWDTTRCELEVLRASRPLAPAPLRHTAPGVTDRMLEAACAVAGKAPDIEKKYDEQTLDAAHKRFPRGLSLQGLILEAAWAHGYTGQLSNRDWEDALRFAFGTRVEAGFSSIDISGILSNIANKFLLEGFFSVERVWRSICAVRNVSDFKTVTSYRLVGRDQFEPLSPGGELKHGSLGEEKYQNKADTYGLMFTIKREDIINDDLGAITAIPRKLGRGAGLKINDVFWKEFLNNVAFFAAANKNYLAGADTALGIDGLTKAEVAFMEQVDTDNKPIGVMPSILLVPPALNAIASQLNKSLELRDTTPNSKFPIANPHQGKFRTEVSRYLSNSSFPGFSSKAWYLLADPNDLPVIEVAFLNGQESPTIETADVDFKSLGIQMRGYNDFGVAKQDPRGGVKAKGEV